MSLELQPVGAAANETSPAMQRLLDLKLPIAVVLGRAVWPIGEVLKLTSGSTIELDRTVSDYVDLVIHGTLVARGQIVSIKGNYGVRIKQIISAEDRLAVSTTSNPDHVSFEN